MRRNNNVIGAKIEPSSALATGVFDLHDQIASFRENKWPPTVKISSLSHNTTVTEGGTITFSVSVDPSWWSGVLFYSIYTITGYLDGSDFSDGLISGSFSVSSGSGSIVKTLTAGGGTENDSFLLYVRVGSAAGTIIATSNVVTVTDTADTIIYFTTTSAPTGITVVTPTPVGIEWNSSLGLKIWGDSNASAGAYTIQTTNNFTGSYTFQFSFKPNDLSCPDPGVVFWPSSSGRSAPVWNWGTYAGRKAYQHNCTTPTLYGETLTSSGTGISYSSQWYTVTLRHNGSTNTISASVRVGNQDWGETGTLLTSSFSIAESYGLSTPYYFGISADADGATSSSNFTQFSALRIVPGA